tara:strand:+ start:779 stop:1036 length:258 start_codon:yes stop_codon:yes gene_type:complete
MLIIILLSFNGFLISEEVPEKNITPLDGELLLPEGYNNTAEEKKCITVCSQWGEDCILNINPSATGAGTSRKCRRVCKSFAETCF